MFFRRSCKSEIKIDRNVIFNNQVLQNGCKYTQDSTTLLFSINLINFSALNLNFIAISSKCGCFGGVCVRVSCNLNSFSINLMEATHLSTVPQLTPFTRKSYLSTLLTIYLPNWYYSRRAITTQMGQQWTMSVFEP